MGSSSELAFPISNRNVSVVIKDLLDKTWQMLPFFILISIPQITFPHPNFDSIYSWNHDFPSFPCLPITQIISRVLGLIYSNKAFCHGLKITLSRSIFFLCFIYNSFASLYSLLRLDVRDWSQPYDFSKWHDASIS